MVKTTNLSLAAEEACIAGAQAEVECSDLRWVLSQSGGNPAVRLMAYGLRKIFRGSLDAVTVDLESFRQALTAAPKDAPWVLIPIHRSYFDFLAAGYLLYARPDIDIPLPHIAAAEEFGQMPLVGPLLAKCGAFFIKRGKGKEDFELTEQINQLVANRDTFEFFIEGTRSRSRQFLPPKRGLLRCLQGTQQRFAILPIAISYDRVPEEQSFERELSGQAKEKMTLGKLLAWYQRMRRGEISLGRMHICCAPPLVLDAKSDIAVLAADVNASLQKHTAASDYHLQQFCQQHPEAAVTAEQLKQAIENRGGLVMLSSLTQPDLPPLPVCIQRSFRYQWMHWFMEEALTAQPNNPALVSFAEQTCYIQADLTAVSEADRIAKMELVRCLFKPITDNYEFVARYCGLKQPQLLSARQLLEAMLNAAVAQGFEADVPVFENAIHGLLQHGLLIKNSDGQLSANNINALESFAEQCRWQGI